jgi:hypothetical protein
MTEPAVPHRAAAAMIIAERQRRRMSIIGIPSWMDEIAPGAAEAARAISVGKLSRLQHERLARLTSEVTRSVWRELKRSHSSKRRLSDRELWKAQHELIYEAYRAADFQPVSPWEIEQSKTRIKELGAAIFTSALELRTLGCDKQLAGMWRAYRNNRRSDRLLHSLPDHPSALADVLEPIADFCERAATHYKPEGPIPPVRQVRDSEALKTTVIRNLAQVCEKHFGSRMYGTVANLANASLGRTDINAVTVRASLRPPWRKIGR